MKALRSLWEGFVGLVIRLMFASFFFGLGLVLLVTLLDRSLRRNEMPPDTPLSPRGRLALLLAILTLAINAYLCLSRGG